MEYIEKARNAAKNLVENIENKVTASTKKTEIDLNTKENNAADSVTIIAKVSVNNPYNIDISILKATYVFSYGDGKKVNGILQDQGKLKAKTENMLDVRVKVPHSSLKSPGYDHHMDIDYRLGMNITIDIPVIGHVIIPVSGIGKFRRPTTTMSDFLSDQGGGLQDGIVHEMVRVEEVNKQEAASQKNVAFRP